MPEAITNRSKAVSLDAVQGQRLRVVPIIGPSHDQPPYEVLRSETMNQVQVTETSEAGSVPELHVQNNLDVRVFLMDGQELIGAKQNRILNTDVLVPARSGIKIPVSCVEHGRWRNVSPSFSPGKAASHRTRHAKMSRVHESLKSGQRHDANQSAVWNEVAESLSHSAAASPTMALSDAYAKRDQELVEFRRSLQMPSEAVGLAVFHNQRFQGLDLFARHSTLVYFWESLLDSYALDLLAEPVDPAEPQASLESQTIRQVLDGAAGGNWERFKSPGEGTDWRLEDAQMTGSALVWDERVVMHLQLFPKIATESGSYRPRVFRPYGRR